MERKKEKMVRKTGSFVLTAMLLLSVFAVFPVPVAAAGEIVSIGSAADVASGSTITIPISIANVNQITGLSANLVYDTSVVTVASITANNSVFTSTVTPGGPEGNKVIALVNTQNYPSCITTTEDTPIIDVTFNVVGTAGSSTTLDLQNVMLTDTGYDTFAPETVNDGEVTVEGVAPTPEVVINEFVSDNATEWVELYNKGSSSVDLTGWALEDEVGNSKPLSGTIGVDGYIVFTYTSGWLNNGGDIIWLNSTTENVDRVGYGTSGGAPAPGASKSTGRYPNGVDTDDDAADFIEFGTPTPEAANEIPLVLTTIIVSPSTATLKVGDTEQFAATAYDQYDKEMTGVTFTWESSDTGVGTINATTGLFTAVDAGATLLNATADSITGTADVTVYVPAVTDIEVVPSTATLKVGDTEQFAATAYDQYDEEMTGVTFTWESSDTGVGTIDTDGLFTAVDVGATLVNATADSVTGTADVTVYVPAVTDIEVAPSTATLKVGETEQFTATAKDQYGDPMTVTFAWTSSDTGVGTIDTDGLFTAVGAGATVVNATADSVTGTADVSVAEVPTPTPAPTIRRGGGGGTPRDTDGDGYTDIQELLAGTNERDPCDPNPESAACLAISPPTAAPTPAATPAAPTPTVVTVPPPAATPAAPTPEATEEPGGILQAIPGFESIFVVAGALAVAFLLLRRKRK